MDNENTMSPEQKLANLNAERKELKSLVSERKIKRLAESSEKRKARDNRISYEKTKLKDIQKVLYSYNKAPQTKKVEMDVLVKIVEIVNEKDHVGVDVAQEGGDQTTTE